MGEGREDQAPGVGARVASWFRRFVGEPAEHRGPVLVACSGGADSLALLLSLAELPLSLVAIHVDHGLRRGTEAEAALVAEVAQSIGAASETLRVVVSPAGNLLAAARRARYEALAGCALRRGASLVAVGHTATDQAETVAFRRERGDLPAAHALAGMPVVRPLGGGAQLIRPLLGAAVMRAEARALVESRGIRPFDDPSNEQERFARVRLRRALAAAGPQAVSELLEQAAAAARSLAADEQAAEALGDPLALDALRVAASSPAVVLRLLRHAGLHRAGLLHARAVLALAATTDGSRGIDLGGGLRAERCYDRLCIGRPDRGRGQLPAIQLPVHGPGLYPFLDRVVELRIVPASSPPAGEAWPPAGEAWPPAGEALDPACLDQPLVLRNLRPGDRLRGPLGGRKLHDVFIDRKVPRAHRALLALLAPAGSRDVLWAEWVGCAAPGRAAPGALRRLALFVHSPTEIGARSSSEKG